MTPPPPPGHGTGPQPDRDSGLPGGMPGNPGALGGPGGGHGSRGGGRGGHGSDDCGPGSGPDGRRGVHMPPVPVGGRDARLPMFARGDAGDRFPAGWWLAMMLDELSGPDRRCPAATDDELIGLMGRWAVVESWAAAGKLGVLAELVRRRALPGHENARPAGLPGAFEEGTGHEAAVALALSLPGADKLVELACTLQARLPRIYALLTAGVLTYIKAQIIADELAVLDDEHAAQAEALIADQVAGKTPGQVAKLAAAAVVAVDPAGATRRRKQAEKDDARVRLWRERSGTAALAGYGLPTDAALAANANVAARAREYKQAKLDGSMDQLRTLAFLDLLNGIAAHDRIAQARAEADAGAQASTGAQAGDGQSGGRRGGGFSGDDGGGVADAADGNGSDHVTDSREGGGSGHGRNSGHGHAGNRSGSDADPAGDEHERGAGPAGNGPGHASPAADSSDGAPATDDSGDGGDDGDGSDGSDGSDAPSAGQPGGDAPCATAPTAPGAAGPGLTASTNLTIPLATVQDLAGRPGHSHALGPLDPALARDLAAAAARSPHSTWCITIVGPEGYAIGHGCARPARRKRGKPPPGGGSRGSSWAFTPRDEPGPPGGWGTWTLTVPGGRDYIVKLGPIPVTDCDHRHESHGYQPSDLLKHLVQIRDGTCTFPCCSRHAKETDFEHAIPYDKGGRTCGCNAGARSRRCHRVKQSRGWSVTQPLPGWHQWRTPSGRTYTQEPMKYPA